MDSSTRASDKNENKINIVDLLSLKHFLKSYDNSENIFYISKVPEVCKDYPCVIGIDEAGRGPVLGPMVYGISFCPIFDMIYLDKLECVDSKTLNEKKRDIIFSNICKSTNKLGFAVEIMSPNYISNSMLSRSKHSLNQISIDAAVKLIKALMEAGVKVAHIYVDTVGKPEKYQAYLLSLFPDLEINVEKKADSTYPIVSMASICAKVVRDYAVKNWQFKENVKLEEKNYGSGYPSDATTKKFLEYNCDPVFGYPQFVRFSWSTTESYLREHSYLVEFDDESHKSSTSQPTTSISSFFNIPTKSKKPQHDFFKKRCLSREVEF